MSVVLRPATYVLGIEVCVLKLYVKSDRGLFLNEA